MTGADEPGGGRTPLQLVRGEASAEEIAALLAVLATAVAERPAPAARPRSEWASREGGLRRGLSPGAGAWRASSLPR